MSITNHVSEFYRVRNVPHQYEPIIECRKLNRKKVGTWFFGLLPVYEYYYTEWEQQEPLGEAK